MSDKLSRIFDFQRFSRNEKLQSLIDETSRRYELAEEYIMSDTSLAFVAGGRKTTDEEEQKKDQEGLL